MGCDLNIYNSMSNTKYPLDIQPYSRAFHWKLESNPNINNAFNIIGIKQSTSNISTKGSSSLI